MDGDTPEWMQLLGESDEEHDDPKAGAGDARAPAVVEDEDDATKFFAAVKSRFQEFGDENRYHDFVAAISSEPPRHAAAVALLRGHADLQNAFRKCFGTPAAAAGARQRPPARSARADTKKQAVADAKAQAASALSSETEARISQLVQLLFRDKVGHEQERARVAAYAAKRAAKAAFPQRLFILRGPAGIGKSTWAERSLLENVDTAAEDLFAARLIHACSVDDFFMQFVSDSTSVMRYAYDPKCLQANEVMNEARVRLAMEIGIEPLYVDNANITLWEMRSYVMLADQMGYDVTVVSPDDISSLWRDVDFLTVRNNEQTILGKRVERSALEAAIRNFEDLVDGEDPSLAIRAAEKPTIEDGTSQQDNIVTLLPPCVVMYKLDMLLNERTQLVRYIPPDGKGWGIRGDVDGSEHSFREKGDGSCCYEDGSSRAWQTGVPETSWTFADLAMLESYKAQVKKLPEAEKPAEDVRPALHPALEREQAIEDAEIDDEVAKSGGPVMSRKERMKQRVQWKAKVEEEVERYRAVKTGPRAPVDLGAMKVEASAGSFLPSAPPRMDMKALVNILKGHDDLMEMFQERFATEAQVTRIKELEEDTPHPPSNAPGSAVKSERFGRVKQESGTPASVKAAWGSVGDRPHAPPGPPPSHRVKQELGRNTVVKAEVGRRVVKSELGGNDEGMPRPPSTDPRAPRSSVTIADVDTVDDDVPSEAAITAAVKKGRDSCIAELAKLIFHKERIAHEGARPRLGMVRYATRRAAHPRFPRELFILRGAPGIGKTNYAMQQLVDMVDVEPGEEEASRLTHICAMDDFFETYDAEGAQYQFNPNQFEGNHVRNEVRVRLAMEAGIHPIYVDCPNMRLWEMRPYVKLADRLGYVITVVEPTEITSGADDLEFLVAANDAAMRKATGKGVSKAALTAILGTYEPAGEDSDVLAAIRASERQAGEGRVIEARSAPAAGAASKRRGMQLQPPQKRLRVKAEFGR
eukprot:TRINITY_DN23505_c0_g1_i1.p1 TRINITY_DN23505_c0_g1~~TRINITY_DN23505_c0_g1_i1.p1  ORF type:complete len:997 (-),score=180.55 TRINITY_DN23505_c0_g1_i1:47-2992(-)